MSINPSQRIGPARRFAVATAVVGLAVAGASGLAFADPGGKKSESPKPSASATHSETARPEPTKTEEPKPEPSKTEPKPEPSKTEPTKTKTPEPTSTTGYPPVPASCSTDTGTVGFRGQVRFSCTGFGPNELVAITITRKGKTRAYTLVTAEASGKFTIFVRVGEAGQTTITATGLTTHKSASATVLVLKRHHNDAVVLPNSSAAAANTVSVPTAALPAVAGAPGTRLVSASDSANYNAATATWGAVGVMGLGAGLLMLAMAKRRKENFTS